MITTKETAPASRQPVGMEEAAFIWHDEVGRIVHLNFRKPSDPSRAIETVRFTDFEGFARWLDENRFMEILREDYWERGARFDETAGVIVTLETNELKWVGDTWWDTEG